jgi:hypothetical protein
MPQRMGLYVRTYTVQAHLISRATLPLQVANSTEMQKLVIKSLMEID